MRGRQVFMDSLQAHGVEAIFGNPGTTENSVLRLRMALMQPHCFPFPASWAGIPDGTLSA